MVVLFLSLSMMFLLKFSNSCHQMISGNPERIQSRKSMSYFNVKQVGYVRKIMQKLVVCGQVFSGYM